MLKKIIAFGITTMLTMTIVTSQANAASFWDWIGYADGTIDSTRVYPYLDNTPGDDPNAPGLAAFQRTNLYIEGQFQDVTSSSWCVDSVRAVCEYGIMYGQSDTYFGVNKNITVAEAVAIAARLHSTYFGKDIDTNFSADWYQPYVDYAVANNIFLIEYDDYSAPCSREDFALLISGSIPNSATPQINNIKYGALWDVSSGSPYYDAYMALSYAGVMDKYEEEEVEFLLSYNSKNYAKEHMFESSTAYKAIYRLYCAGILSGSDEYGTFTPNANITRDSVATILARVLDPTQRKNITLKSKPQTIVPFSQLGNKAALRKKATNDELEQAYNAISDMIKALSNCSVEAQICGIATDLRARYYVQSKYSMSAPHYNDPYGYIIFNTASCAGAARSACLGLEMLGLKYEHVGADQYSHQWARVNVNGIYWICDGYGVACPEPSAYGHPTGS